MLKGIRECLAQSDGGALKDGEIAAVLDEILGQTMWARRVLLVPPDITRYYSYAGRRDHGGLRRQRRNRGGYSRGGADRTDTGADMLHSVQRVLLSPEVFTGAACVTVGAAARRGRAT